jgi:hypothetical protein
LILNIILAGIFAFLSSLTKGIQGLFPIAAVFFYWLVKKDFTFKQNVIYSFLLVVTPIAIYGLLFLYDFSIFETLKQYLENRLGKAFNATVHNTTSNRFEILIRLFTELIPMFILMFITFLMSKKIKQNDFKLYKSEILWLILIGLSGSLPLMSTLEQRGFYLVTSLPFFAIAGAICIGDRLTQLINKINIDRPSFKNLKWITVVLVTASFIYTITCIGKTKRDKDILSDIYTIGKIIPRGEIITVPSEMLENWNIRTYMVRHFYISIDGPDRLHNFYLIKKDLPKTLVPQNYVPYPITTKYMDLYIPQK